MITIKITGSRGEGKTTTAVAILRMLRDLRQDVKYSGHSRDAFEDAKKIPASAMNRYLNTKKKFLVIDNDPPNKFKKPSVQESE